MLIFDSHGGSHQRLSQGDTDHDDVVLVMDQLNPVVRQVPAGVIHPRSSAPAAIECAFDDLPSPAIQWQPATEDEGGWPVGAGY